MGDKKLFSYGALRYKAAQLSIFGSQLHEVQDILNG